MSNDKRPDEYRILLPMTPPGKKNRYRFGGGRIWKTKKTTSFELLAKVLVRRVITRVPFAPYQAKVNIQIRRTDRHRFDIDNCSTAVLDCLNISIDGFDDAEVVELQAVKSYNPGARGNETEITIQFIKGKWSDKPVSTHTNQKEAIL